jgi:uncharacterized protein (TIGR02757 family)
VEEDPVRYVHRYASPLDREAAGFAVALLTYGNVKQIFRSAETMLEALGPSPRNTLEAADYAEWRRRLKGFRHRFTTGRQMACVFVAIRRIFERHGSLENAFLENYRPGAPLRPALEAFVDKIYEAAPEPVLLRGHLVPAPRKGSSCKRLLMFLRWMARGGDGIDAGTWTRVRPADLVVPLDTHLLKISRLMNWGRRRSQDWKRAEEVTARLRRLCPEDPLRYDFALCHMGILRECRARRVELLCSRCPLQPHCRLWRKR